MDIRHYFVRIVWKYKKISLAPENWDAHFSAILIICLRKSISRSQNCNVYSKICSLSTNYILTNLVGYVRIFFLLWKISILNEINFQLFHLNATRIQICFSVLKSIIWNNIYYKILDILLLKFVCEKDIKVYFNN